MLEYKYVTNFIGFLSLGTHILVLVVEFFIILHTSFQ